MSPNPDPSDEQSNTNNFFAVTHLGQNGQPDHTVYSIGTLRRSFDSDKGENIRNDHFAVNGERGSAVNRNS